MDGAVSFLLPTLVLLAAGTAILLAARLRGPWQRLGSRAGGSRRGPAAPGAPGSPPAEEPPPQGPAAAGSPPYIPCGCGPACGPCAAAARELQELVAPLWPGVSFPRDSQMWQLCWEDLEQLLERGRLPCCASCGPCSSSGSPRPARSPGESGQAQEGENTGDASRCSLQTAGLRGNGSSLRMHVAKKNLEVKLRAQPVPVRRSQERLVQQEAPSHSSESLPSSSSPSGSCQSQDGDSTDSSACSSGSVGISRTRSALRMHVAKKSLEVKLGVRPDPVRSSQKRVAEDREKEGQSEAGEAQRGTDFSVFSAVQPDGSSLRSESEKILQRQRELEFPHLRGVPPSQMKPLFSLQILLRMLCFK